jgi:short-subunit dehydrogenase
MALPPPDPGSTALVTGASSGLGEAFARQLAERGHGVTLVARREDRLRELAGKLASEHGVRAEAIAADLADPAARDRLAAEVDRLGLTVEILLNNAGFGTYDDFVESPREREVEMTRVTVEAVVDLTARYLPGMVERGRGAVITTCSTAAFQPIPGNAGYAAGKAFALNFTEALHTETAKSGVTVTALCPGPVHTGFQAASGAEDFAKTLPKPMWKSAEKVAAAGLRGAERGKRVVVPGVPNKAGALMGRLTPKPILLRVLRAQGS